MSEPRLGARCEARARLQKVSVRRFGPSFRWVRALPLSVHATTRATQFAAGAGAERITSRRSDAPRADTQIPGCARTPGRRRRTPRGHRARAAWHISSTQLPSFERSMLPRPKYLTPISLELSPSGCLLPRHGHLCAGVAARGKVISAVLIEKLSKHDEWLQADSLRFLAVSQYIPMAKCCHL
jgi:hypothetical protein